MNKKKIWLKKNKKRERKKNKWIFDGILFIELNSVNLYSSRRLKSKKN